MKKILITAALMLTFLPAVQSRGDDDTTDVQLSSDALRLEALYMTKLREDAPFFSEELSAYFSTVAKDETQADRAAFLLTSLYKDPGADGYDVEWTRWSILKASRILGIKPFIRLWRQLQDQVMLHTPEPYSGSLFVFDVNPLIQQFGSEESLDFYVENFAALGQKTVWGGLQQFGHKGMGRLLAGIPAMDKNSRIHALTILELTADHQLVEGLRTLLAEENDPEVKVGIAGALAASGDRQTALEFLRKLDPTQYNGLAAIQLADYGDYDDVVSLCDSESINVRTFGILGLRRFALNEKHDALTLLIAILGESDEVRSRVRAVRALDFPLASKPIVAEALRRAMQEDLSEDVRYGAAEILAQADDKSAIATLWKLYHEGEADRTRSLSLMTLARFGELQALHEMFNTKRLYIEGGLRNVIVPERIGDDPKLARQWLKDNLEHLTWDPVRCAFAKADEY